MPEKILKKTLVLLSLLAVCGLARAQHIHIVPLGCEDCEEDHHIHNEGVSVSRNFTGLAPRFGLSWQKEFFAEVGLTLDIYRIHYIEASEFVSFGYWNARPYVSGEIMLKKGKTIGGPKAGFEFIMSTNLFGMAAGLETTWYTDGRLDALAITPRVIFSFVYAEIYYGYNIYTHNNLRPYLGNHRIGATITLNPRFWKRKKAMYADYYDSYLTP